MSIESRLKKIEEHTGKANDKGAVYGCSMNIVEADSEMTDADFPKPTRFYKTVNGKTVDITWEEFEKTTKLQQFEYNCKLIDL